MTIKVTFIDTSILCNLVPVPGLDQDRSSVIAEMQQRRDAGEKFILPMTSIIETGNHIAHIPDGRERRTAATTFSGMIDLIVRERAPWTLHQFEWGRDFLTLLNSGSATGATLIDHAVNRFGTGDLCVLAEREEYRKRAKLHAVTIWTLDEMLSAYS